MFNDCLMEVKIGASKKEERQAEKLVSLCTRDRT